MPINRKYTVRQEREIEVTAEDPTQAIRLADDIFRNFEQMQDQNGHLIAGPVRVTSIDAREAY